MQTTIRQRTKTILNGQNDQNAKTKKSWNEEYFPTNQQVSTWESMGLKNSLINCSDDTSPQQLNQLLEYYQAENQEIKGRNQKLVEIARLMKEKEKVLLEEIAVLQMQYRKLQNSVKKQSSKQPFSDLKLQNAPESGRKPFSKEKKVVKQSSFALENPSHSSVNGRSNLIETITTQFYQLIEESICQQNLQKKKSIRKQLAKLATQIKKAQEDPQYKGKQSKASMKTSTTNSKQSYMKIPLSKQTVKS